MSVAPDPQQPSRINSGDLASMADFTLGSATVSPSTRSIRGPQINADVEPRVMQVLVALANERGQVVSRERLFERCWDGVVVGDDSLNRAVAGVRKLAADVAGGSFTVETIPRTGYRLIDHAGDNSVAKSGTSTSQGAEGMSRRAVVATSLGALLVAAGGGAFWWRGRQRDERFARLMKEGDEALDYGDGSDRAARAFQLAVDLDPDNAAAQGKLAYALTVNGNRVIEAGAGPGVMDRAGEAARTSLSIDPLDIYARLASIELDQANLDMFETDARLSGLLTEAPRNIDILRRLWSLRQSAGLSRDALGLVKRAMAIKPLSASNNYPFGQLLWITGHDAEADRILERATEYWPDHRYVRFARFNLLAFTGRTGQAEAMIDNPATRPQSFTPPSVALWRIALTALGDPTPANIAAATVASQDAVAKIPLLTSQAVLSLAKLGQIDAAFDIANQLLQFQSAATTSKTKGSSVAWRFAPWLFTPPAQAMQRDPRFMAICDAIGLSAYWEKRGITPDFLTRPA